MQLDEYVDSLDARLAAYDASDAAVCIDNALAHLRYARMWLRSAQAPRTLVRVEVAISSAKGARRNARRRAQRASVMRGQP